MRMPQGLWTPVARLLRPQGRRGELLAEPLTDLLVFSIGRQVAIGGLNGPTGDALETTIESCWAPSGKNSGRLVLKLAGCDSITEAERLARHDLFISAGDLPALDADTWYVRDLIGCTLFDRDAAVGTISGVEYPMAADGRTRLAEAAPLLEVGLPLSDEPALVPFVRAWLESVDLEQRRVVMHLPAGLIALGTPDE